MAEVSEVKTTAADSAEVIVRELERRTERLGPQRPEVAVHWVRSAAAALGRAQKLGEHVDAGACVHWLGSVLFHALTGQAPLGPLPGVLSPEAPPLASSLSPYWVPRSLDAVIGKCLARRRTERFSTVAELHFALSAVLVTETDMVLQSAAA